MSKYKLKNIYSVFKYKNKLFPTKRLLIERYFVVNWEILLLLAPTCKPEKSSGICWFFMI